jgi:hypothetical protein
MSLVPSPLKSPKPATCQLTPDRPQAHGRHDGIVADVVELERAGVELHSTMSLVRKIMSVVSLPKSRPSPANWKSVAVWTAGSRLALLPRS